MKTTTAAKIDGYEVIETKAIGTVPAKRAAELFGAALGADRGYSSRIVRVNNRTYDCVASDGRAVRFENPRLRAL